MRNDESDEYCLACPLSEQGKQKGGGTVHATLSAEAYQTILLLNICQRMNDAIVDYHPIYVWDSDKLFVHEGKMSCAYSTLV